MRAVPPAGFPARLRRFGTPRTSNPYPLQVFLQERLQLFVVVHTVEPLSPSLSPLFYKPFHSLNTFLQTGQTYVTPPAYAGRKPWRRGSTPAGGNQGGSGRDGGDLPPLNQEKTHEDPFKTLVHRSRGRGRLGRDRGGVRGVSQGAWARVLSIPVFTGLPRRRES